MKIWKFFHNSCRCNSAQDIIFSRSGLYFVSGNFKNRFWSCGVTSPNVPPGFWLSLSFIHFLTVLSRSNVSIDYRLRDRLCFIKDCISQFRFMLRVELTNPRTFNPPCPDYIGQTHRNRCEESLFLPFQ